MIGRRGRRGRRAGEGSACGSGDGFLSGVEAFHLFLRKPEQKKKESVKAGLFEKGKRNEPSHPNPKQLLEEGKVSVEEPTLLLLEEEELKTTISKDQVRKDPRKGLGPLGSSKPSAAAVLLLPSFRSSSSHSTSSTTILHWLLYPSPTPHPDISSSPSPPLLMGKRRRVRWVEGTRRTTRSFRSKLH